MSIRSFNPVAGAYTQNVSPYRFTQFLTLVHELNLKGNETVLDIGCGAGVLSLEAARRLEDGGSLHGIDLAPEMVHLARKAADTSGLSNVRFDLGDATRLDFEDNSFDTIMSSNAFPWVPDRPLFLREVHRVLKPGGLLGLVSLSDSCYREFVHAFQSAAADHPDMLPSGNPMELAGGRLLKAEELVKMIDQSGLHLEKQFNFSTVEPITAEQYFQRVDSIVNEGYLDHLSSETDRLKAREYLYHALAGSNGSLRITESSLFAMATKAA